METLSLGGYVLLRDCHDHRYLHAARAVCVCMLLLPGSWKVL
jgi:hypothetical protein